MNAQEPHVNSSETTKGSARDNTMENNLAGY